MAKLHFMYATMDSGKSAHLLQNAFNYEQRGLAPLVLTSGIDTREGVGIISSRIGLKREAIAVSESDSILTIYDKQSIKPNIVLIDEAQFLNHDQILELTQIVDTRNCSVLAYGLRTDFRGEPFEGSKYLLAWADELVELVTICSSGKKALMNARVDANGKQESEGEQVSIGYNYVPMGRARFDLAKVRKG